MASLRRITIDDLGRVRWPSQPRLSPDGLHLALTVTRFDEDADRIASAVVVYDVATGNSRHVGDPHAGRDHSPRWSPDGGWLGFISDRTGGPAVWRLDLSTDQLERASDGHGSASDPRWAPDSMSIAYVRTDATGHDAGVPYKVAPFRWRVDGIGATPCPTRSHIWIAHLDGRPDRQVTSGDWGDDMPRFSPDGHRLAFRSNRTPARDRSSTAGLWIVDLVDGTTRDVRPPDGPINAVEWSPSGDTLAYIGHHRGEAQGFNPQLWTLDLATGSERSLTTSLDRPIGQVVRSDAPAAPLGAEIAWDARGGSCHVAYADGGASVIARVELSGRVDVALAGGRVWDGLSLAADRDELAALSAEAEDPGQVIVTTADGRDPRVVASPAAQWRKGVKFGSLERLEVRGRDGRPSEAWLQHPATAEAAKLPIILYVHGGPHWPIGPRFNLEIRRLAERGYRVLLLNPRGATGLGDAHAQGNVGDWGGADVEDLLAALDVACARDDVDPSRQAVMGESYGGFIALWLIATTERFRAAVVQNGIADLSSAYLTADDPTAYEWDLAGSPWTRPEFFRERSPLAHVDRIRASLLLVHAELDASCPIAQSEQIHAALRLLGRDVEFLRLPGEGHFVSVNGRPSSLRARAAAIDQFLSTRLGRRQDPDHLPPWPPAP